MRYIDVCHYGTGKVGNDSKQEEAIVDSKTIRLVGAGSNDCSASCYDQGNAEQDTSGSLRSCELCYDQTYHCVWSPGRFSGRSLEAPPALLQHRSTS